VADWTVASFLRVVVAWIWIFLILRAKSESPDANEKIALLCALKVGNRGGRCTREDLNARWGASSRAAKSRSFEAYAFEPDGWMCERVFVRLRAFTRDFATGWGFSALIERERGRSFAAMVFCFLSVSRGESLSMSLVVVVVKSSGGERSMTFLFSLLATHTYQNVFFLSYQYEQQRNIELGRVALVNLKADKLYGKLVVVVDLVDQNRVLVDAPGIKRCIINLKRLAITPIKLDTGRCPDAAALAAAHKGAAAEFAASKWGQKIARQSARKALTDFDRFKVAIARSKRSAIVKKAMA
jgi:large subunit ribosomal protein L14e